MNGAKHVMLDLETLGVGPTAAILTIGWCVFDPWQRPDYEPRTMMPRKIQVDVTSCIDRGMHVSDSTVRWWLQQTDEARAELCTSVPVPIEKALNEFAQEFRGDEYVWGNGASFDNAIMETAYHKCGIQLPWRFYNNRCYRTLKNLAPSVPPVEPKIPHCAASDAQAQALHTQAIYQHLGL